MVKKIIHIPHSSSHIPFYDGYVATKKTINEEIMLLTDWFTDDLFRSDDDIMVVADFSRIFCDVERFADDSQEPMAAFGMGALYTHLDNGKPMRMVSTRLKERIMTEYYHKHHQKLTNAVASQLEIAGQALIFDCHSFPDQPFRRDLDQSCHRPDICIGTDKFHSPKDLVACSTNYFIRLGYSVSVNSPYSGSIVPMRYYRKDKRVTSIMIEINRKLYLKDHGNEKSDTYDTIKRVVQGYFDLLSQLH